ncbi:MAG TPA: hypothetical protein VFY87_05460 [Geminicoccaceae bacterium]|nr:hypothetical protein [Geminicoccaceae bacterium]
MRTPTLLAAACGLAALVASCATPPEPNAPSFGEAPRRNILIQAVNPEGAPPLAFDPGFDGDRALIAIDRYKADKVKRPEGIETTTVGGGSSGGGGGGGGG